MLHHLLKNTTFSTAIDHASDIIKNLRTIFETSDSRLLDTLCDVNTDKKNGLKMALEKNDPV